MYNKCAFGTKYYLRIPKSRWKKRLSANSIELLIVQFIIL